MKLLTEYTYKNLNLRNRIVMPPMCMYQAKEGKVNSFHEVHYTTRSIGGVGLIIVEATAVSQEGRITDDDLGIWSDDHISGLRKMVTQVKEHGAQIALQLAHAGRKSVVSHSKAIAPSALPFSSDYNAPKKLTIEEIHSLQKKFLKGAKRAHKAGFDAIEIHGAHGYLINAFLSPLSNKRRDEYGGTLDNRMRFLKDILEALPKYWPKDKTLILRLSADEYHKEGNGFSDICRIVEMAKSNGVDMINVSSGGVIPAKVKSYPGYQIPLSESIKKQVKIETIAGGLITDEKLAEEIINNNRGDLVYFGRHLLKDPYFPAKTALKYGDSTLWHESYERAVK